MNKYSFSLIIILSFFLAERACAQMTPPSKAIGIRVSSLVNLEAVVDWQVPLSSKIALTFSSGLKYYPNLHSALPNNTHIKNYYTAKVNSALLNRGRAPDGQLSHPIGTKNVIEFYYDTYSLNKYGKIVPVVTIPIQLNYRQYLGKKNKKNRFFIHSGLNLYAHFGQRVKTTTTFLNLVEPASSPTSRFFFFTGETTGKFKEEMDTRSGLAFTTTISSGFGWQFPFKDKYFVEVNPIVEFNLQYADSLIKYHGFRQIQPQMLVTLGRYLR